MFLPNWDAPGRKAKLTVRFCPVNLRTPHRFDNRDPLKVYAIYATEIDCPEGETPLSWMLLTTEVVADVNMAATILHWYTYRWRVEEYHKILKSGCQSERYRLAAVGMKTLLGFLSVIAVELLQVTYLHRTQQSCSCPRNPQSSSAESLKARIPYQTTQDFNSCLGSGDCCLSGGLSRTPS